METLVLEHNRSVDCLVVLLMPPLHVIEDGFAYYTAFEVTEEQDIPNGMVEIRVPELTYMKTTVKKGDDIQQTYSNLHHWLFESDYLAYKENNVNYYDEHMPIKHEHYPIDLDSNAMQFDIYIPIVRL